MKIGIITCLCSNDVCTGALCLKAFNSRTHTFSEYSEDTNLSVFMTCNGCKSRQPLEPEDDLGMQEKLERLVQEGVEVMHVGVCTWFKDKENNQYQCDRMQKICHQIQSKGIRVVQGTH